MSSYASRNAAAVVPEVSSASAAFLFEEDIADEYAKNHGSRTASSGSLHHLQTNAVQNHQRTPSSSNQQQQGSGSALGNSASTRKPNGGGGGGGGAGNSRQQTPNAKSPYFNASSGSRYEDSGSAAMIAAMLEGQNQENARTRREQELLDQLAEMQQTLDTLSETIADSEKERVTMATQLTEALEASNALLVSGTPATSSTGAAAAVPPPPPSWAEQELEELRQRFNDAVDSAAEWRVAAERAEAEAERLRRELEKSNKQARESASPGPAQPQSQQPSREVSPDQAPGLGIVTSLVPTPLMPVQGRRAGSSQPQQQQQQSLQRAATFHGSPLAGSSAGYDDANEQMHSNSVNSNASGVIATLETEVQRLRIENRKREILFRANEEKLWMIVRHRTKQVEHISAMLAHAKMANVMVLRQLLEKFNGRPSETLHPTLAAPQQANGYRHHHHHRFDDPTETSLRHLQSAQTLPTNSLPGPAAAPVTSAAAPATHALGRAQSAMPPRTSTLVKGGLAVPKATVSKKRWM